MPVTDVKCLNLPAEKELAYQRDAKLEVVEKNESAGFHQKGPGIRFALGSVYVIVFVKNQKTTFYELNSLNEGGLL